MDQQQYCLRWNNHGSTLVAVFDNLLARESLVDVTLFAEGHLLKAHKVVLSACSAYFERLFSETQDRHPIVVLKDVGHQELRALLEYMYRGEVNVVQDQLEPLIRTAESLRIKGLADGQRGAQGPGTSRPDPDAPTGGSPLSGAGQGTTPTPTSGPSQSQSTPSMIKSEALCPNEPRGGMGVGDVRAPLECRSGPRDGFQLPPSSSSSSMPTVPSVLSTVLTMPPALSLAAAAAAAATPLTSKLKVEGSVLPLDTCPSSPLAKRRRKTRHRSGDTLERDSGGESDGHSSTSPGDPLHQLPRIPATITPVPTPTPSHYHPSQRDETRRDESRRDDDRGERSGDRGERGERGGGTSFGGGSSFSGAVSSFGCGSSFGVGGSSSLLMGGNSLGVGGSSYGEGGGSSSPSPDSLGGSTRGDSAPTPNSLLPRPLSAHEHSSPGLFKPFHPRHDDNSSDANHHSDDDQDASRGAAHDLTTDTAGPSTSRLPQDDQPHTPGYLGWPYPQDPPTSSEDSAFPSLENTNQGIWKKNFLSPYFPPRPHPGLGSPFPGLYVPPPGSPWGSHSPPGPGVLGGSAGGLLCAHECVRCSRLYKTRKGLKHHIKNECGVEPRFQCSHCDWRFKQKAHLLRHVARKHTST